MRHTLAGLASALVALAAGLAPAAACGGYGCAPCAVAVPCGYHGAAAPGHVYDHVDFERLPTIAVPRWYAMPQYYHVNQGPVYTGPGAFAPLPVYRERAVRSRHRHGYRQSHSYGYHGGPYAHPLHHYYAGAPAWHGPMIVRARPGMHRHEHGVRQRQAPRRHAARHQHRHRAGHHVHHRR